MCDLIIGGMILDANANGKMTLKGSGDETLRY